ncbi:MAG: hypothetical protein EXR72_12890 [Myxococcales bacterium]|nr:hypothetical protein [Myxococcales bacterium]
MAPALALGLSACTAPNLDYAPSATGCVAGERACTGSRPVECEPSDGGTRLVNARCPSGATCSSGRCTPPMPARACAKESACGGVQTCSPFVDPLTGLLLATYCVAPEGVNPGGQPCTAGGQCRSNLCLVAGGPSPRQVCFLACQTDDDCSKPLTCRKFSVTVTGVQGTLQGCGPQ